MACKTTIYETNRIIIFKLEIAVLSGLLLSLSPTLRNINIQLTLNWSNASEVPLFRPIGEMFYFFRMWKNRAVKDRGQW